MGDSEGYYWRENSNEVHNIREARALDGSQEGPKQVYNTARLHITRIFHGLKI